LLHSPSTASVVNKGNGRRGVKRKRMRNRASRRRRGRNRRRKGVDEQRKGRKRRMKRGDDGGAEEGAEKYK
jgi:hypothetical protein